MCSALCHCDPGTDDANTKLWDAYGEAFLNKYNRTTTTGSSGSNSQFKNLVFKSDNSVKNYKECYDKVMKAKYKTMESSSS